MNRPKVIWAANLALRAAAHLAGVDDGLVKVSPVLERYGDFANFLDTEDDQEDEFNRLRRNKTTGRPLGGNKWLAQLERQTGRTLKAQKRGSKTQ